jgi:serine phosphatase RsbU (regulator of sigma subunit)
VSLPFTKPTLHYDDFDGENTLELGGECTTIGRSTDQDVVLKEAFASRRHATITRQNGGFEVIDQNSSHGTYLNGKRIDRANLRSGDTLQFGSASAVCYRFEYPESASMSGVRADELLAALSGFEPPTTGNVPKPAREIEKLSFLLSAARQLNSGGAINDVFLALLKLSMQLTGTERGFVFLMKEGELSSALGLRSDGTLIEEDSSVSRRAMQKAVESDSRFYLSDTLSDDSAAQWASVMAHSIRSIYCIPLRKHSQTEPSSCLGVLYLDAQLGAKSLSDIDQQVLDTLATEASTLLHNALLAESELKARQAEEELAIAASIHSGLMSITLPRLDYLELQARTLPCHAIGGDFFDVIELPDCVCLAIADVSGKGVPASIVAATLQGIIHALMLTGQSLPETADLINRFLCTRQVGKYATMILLKVFPGGCVEFLNCGHVPPLLISSSGEIVELETANPIVGLIEQATYEASEITLRSGDRILLTTDGVTEIKNRSGQLISTEGLISIAHLPTLDQIVSELQEIQAGPEAQDDWTLLDIRYTGR